MEGCRVVRGPDWRWGNQDGGEGFVGTVTSRKPTNNPDSPNSNGNTTNRNSSKQLAIRVVWDNGHINMYRAGHASAFDLRIVDNAATGVSHNVPCGECSVKDITGFRWLCNDCKMNVCSSCYVMGKHDNTHKTFQRFDTPQSDPVKVHRKPGAAAQLELKGIFPGALVTRGPDWESGNIDVHENETGIGKVVDSHDLAPGVVRVEWAPNQVSTHQVGISGKRMLRLYRHAVAGHYAPDDFPVLKSEDFDADAFASSHALKLAAGDTVRVMDDAEGFEKLQDKEHGGWLASIEKNCCVSFIQLRSFFINQAALTRTTSYSIGQSVRVKPNKDTTGAMALANVPDETISKIAGETGSVVRYIDDDTVEVKLDGVKDGSVQHKLRTGWIEIHPVVEHVRKSLASLKRSRMMLFADAAASGQLSTVKQLVADFGMAVNERAENGMTALHFASQLGRIDVVNWLLRQGADVHIKDNHGRNAVHVAAAHGRLAIIEHLVRFAAARLNDKDNDGKTPLLLAVQFGCIRTVKTLIENGCDVNAADSNGDTALHHAIYWEVRDTEIYRDHELVDYLAHVSDLTVTNSKKLNALLFAACVPNARVLALLLQEKGETLINVTEANTGQTVLHIACSKCDLKSVKVVVERLREMSATSPGFVQSYLERRCNSDLTPLLFAAERGHYGIVEWLVKQGANVKAKTIRSDTAVHLLAAKLKTFQTLPAKTDSPLIHQIYEQLVGSDPVAVKQYPALSAMCYLVREGCPWRLPASDPAANRVLSEPIVNEVLSKYDIDHEQEQQSADSRSACLLCPGATAIPALFICCGFVYEAVCSACTSKVFRCPDCGLINPEFESRKRRATDRDSSDATSDSDSGHMSHSGDGSSTERVTYVGGSAGHAAPKPNGRAKRKKRSDGDAYTP